jgi:hypothetical protein
MTETIIRTYSELITLSTFKERYEYLKLDGRVGEDTFGWDRYLNQIFYKSKEWNRIRDQVIFRDLGCDLALEGFEIHGRIFIHHMNPISKSDILDRSEFLLNPEYLICTTKATHDAIHYGDLDSLHNEPVIRTKNDTCPWRH